MGKTSVPPARSGLSADVDNMAALENQVSLGKVASAVLFAGTWEAVLLGWLRACFLWKDPLAGHSVPAVYTGTWTLPRQGVLSL